MYALDDVKNLVEINDISDLIFDLWPLFLFHEIGSDNLPYRVKIIFVIIQYRKGVASTKSVYSK